MRLQLDSSVWSTVLLRGCRWLHTDACVVVGHGLGRRFFLGKEIDLRIGCPALFRDYYLDSLILWNFRWLIHICQMRVFRILIRTLQN